MLVILEDAVSPMSDWFWLRRWRDRDLTQILQQRCESKGTSSLATRFPSSLTVTLQRLLGNVPETQASPSKPSAKLCNQADLSPTALMAVVLLRQKGCEAW